MTAITSIRVLLMAAGYIGAALPTLAACPKQNANVPREQAAQRTRVAIAGMIDIDGDGESDLETVRRLIALNGGVIDAEIHVGEESRGQLQRSTHYVIVGELPDKASVAPKVAKQFDAFMSRARQLHVRIIQFGDLFKMGSDLPISEPGKEPFTRRILVPNPPAFW